MKEFDAYLFDADGTLMDTRELIYRSFVHMAQVVHIELPPRPAVEATIGLPVERQVKIFLGENRAPEEYDKAAAAYRDSVFTIYPDFLRLFPGTQEMLAALHKRGKKMAIVTSRRRNGLELFFKQLGIWQYFPVTVTPEDTEKHKPDPEPALLACEKLGVRPEQAVFIGDAEFDIACGKAAGMATALVEWGGMEHRGWQAQPDCIAHSMSDLLPEG